MEKLIQKVSYLKGLAEGLGVSSNTNEGRLIVGIIDALEEMVTAIRELEDSHNDLNEYVESIDHDIQDIEDVVFGDEDHDHEDEDDEDDDYIEVECPNCHETVYFDEESFEDDKDVNCPNCDKSVLDSPDENKDTTK